jgi:hypothetical protein
MTEKQKGFVKWVMYIIHLLSGIATIILYTLFLREDFFIDVTGKVLPIFIGSALIAALFYKNQNQLLKIYFVGLSGLVLLCIGVWIILGLLMMH